MTVCSICGSSLRVGNVSQQKAVCKLNKRQYQTSGESCTHEVDNGNIEVKK